MAEKSLLGGVLDFGEELIDDAMGLYERYAASQAKLNESERKQSTANPDTQPAMGSVQRNADGSPVAVSKTGEAKGYLGLPLWAVILLVIMLVVVLTMLFVWLVK